MQMFMARGPGKRKTPCRRSRISRQPHPRKMAGNLAVASPTAPSSACNPWSRERAHRGAAPVQGRGVVASVAVVLLEVIPDDDRVAVIDRGTERLDHFGHFGVPNGGARKR